MKKIANLKTVGTVRERESNSLNNKIGGEF